MINSGFVNLSCKLRSVLPFLLYNWYLIIIRIFVIYLLMLSYYFSWISLTLFTRTCMSHSFKKTPVCGITTAASEKADKRKANRRLRRVIRQKLLGGEADIMPNLREVSNVWSFAKDGKQYFDRRKSADLLRKWWFRLVWDVSAWILSCWLQSSGMFLMAGAAKLATRTCKMLTAYC